MLKTLVFTALLVLLSTVACAAMSLEDYAEECGEWNEDYGELFGGTLSSSLSVKDLEEALEEWNALSPPGEVGALHDVRAEAYRLFLDTTEENEALEDQLDDLRDELDDAPRRQQDDIRDRMDELSDEQEDLFDDLRDELDGLDRDYQDAFDDLPRRTERELGDQNCI